MTADAGFGHRSAANAIAATLQEMHGDGCITEIVNPFKDRRVPGLLQRSQSDYDRIVREMPNLYGLGYKGHFSRVGDIQNPGGSREGPHEMKKTRYQKAVFVLLSVLIVASLSRL